MSSLLVAGGSAVDLGLDVVAILQALHDRDEELWDDLARALTHGEASDELAEALDADQLALLNRFLGRLSDEVDLPTWLRSLVSPVSELDADTPLAWSFKKDGSGEFPAAGELTFGLGAEATVSARVAPAPTYELEGAFGLSASAKLPFRFGGVAMQSAARVEAALGASFAHDDDTLLVEALAEDLPQLEGLWNPSLLVTPPFEAADLAVSGEIRLGGSLEAGQTFVVDDVDGGVGATVQAGLEYGVSWTRKGRFEIRIERRGSGIGFRVKESRAQATARNLAIGGTLKLSGVKKATRPVMKRLGAFPAPLEKALQKYAAPGTLLRDRLLEKVGGDATLKGLASAALGTTDADAWVDSLVAEVTEALDVRVDGLQTTIEGRAAIFVAGVLMDLNVPVRVRADVEARVAELLTEAADELQDQLRGEVKELLEAQGSRIVEALEQFGAEATDLVTDLDAAAEALMAPMHAAIGKWRDVEKKVADAIEAVESEKFAIRYARSVNIDDEDEYLLDVTIAEVVARTRKAYRAALRGDVSLLASMALDPGDGRVTLEDCVHARVFERKETSGLSINLFGLGEVSASRSLASRLQVRAEAGEVTLLIGSGGIGAEKKWFGESLSVKLTTERNFLGAVDEDDSGLRIIAAYVDDELERGDLRRHLEAYEVQQLTPAGSTARAIAAVEQERVSEKVTISSQIAFSRADLQALAALDDDRIIDEAIFGLTDVLQSHWRAGPLLRRIQESFSSDPSVAAAVKHFMDRPDSYVRSVLGITSNYDSDGQYMLALVSRINRNARNLRDYVRKLEALKGAELPDVGAGGKVDRAQFEALERAHADLVDQLDEWFPAGGFTRDLVTEKVSPVSLALMVALGRLVEKPAALVPVISWKGASGGTERIVAI